MPKKALRLAKKYEALGYAPNYALRLAEEQLARKASHMENAIKLIKKANA